MTGVHVVTIREAGNGVAAAVGHGMHQIRAEQLGERPAVQGLHQTAVLRSLDRRSGHGVHA